MTSPVTDARVSHVTRDDAAHPIGDLDDSVIAAIIATGATNAEIERTLKLATAGFAEGEARTSR